MDMPVQIGPIRVDREIGRGGTGVVYLARDTKLDRDVAIKLLPPTEHRSMVSMPPHEGDLCRMRKRASCRWSATNAKPNGCRA